MLSVCHSWVDQENPQITFTSCECGHVSKKTELVFRPSLLDGSRYTWLLKLSVLNSVDPQHTCAVCHNCLGSTWPDVLEPDTVSRAPLCFSCFSSESVCTLVTLQELCLLPWTRITNPAPAGQYFQFLLFSGVVCVVSNFRCHKPSCVTPLCLFWPDFISFFCTHPFFFISLSSGNQLFGRRAVNWEVALMPFYKVLGIDNLAPVPLRILHKLPICSTETGSCSFHAAANTVCVETYESSREMCMGRWTKSTFLLLKQLPLIFRISLYQNGRAVIVVKVSPSLVWLSSHNLPVLSLCSRISCFQPTCSVMWLYPTVSRKMVMIVKYLALNAGRYFLRAVKRPKRELADTHCVNNICVNLVMAFQCWAHNVFHNN